MEGWAGLVEYYYVEGMIFLRRVTRLWPVRIVLVCLSALLWLFIGESGLFYLYSIRWQWPTSSSTNTSCFKTSHAGGISYCYNSLDDSLHFPELTANKKLTTSRNPETDPSELKMLIYSDLHIMCNYK